MKEIGRRQKEDDVSESMSEKREKLSGVFINKQFDLQMLEYIQLAFSQQPDKHTGHDHQPRLIQFLKLEFLRFDGSNILP